LAAIAKVIGKALAELRFEAGVLQRHGDRERVTQDPNALFVLPQLLQNTPEDNGGLN
jgi:hypothetical protein